MLYKWQLQSEEGESGRITNKKSKGITWRKFYKPMFCNRKTSQMKRHFKQIKKIRKKSEKISVEN
jgi:hypothetical protein